MIFDALDVVEKDWDVPGNLFLSRFVAVGKEDSFLVRSDVDQSNHQLHNVNQARQYPEEQSDQKNYDFFKGRLSAFS